MKLLETQDNDDTTCALAEKSKLITHESVIKLSRRNNSSLELPLRGRMAKGQPVQSQVNLRKMLRNRGKSGS